MLRAQSLQQCDRFLFMRSKKPMALTIDCDGVLFRGVQHVAASIGFILRRDDGLTAAKRPVVSPVMEKYHDLQPLNMRSVAALSSMRRDADRVFLLSDRGQHMKDVTERRLWRAGLAGMFDGVLLNGGTLPIAEWKSSVVRWLAAEGFRVVHVDDDVRRAAAIAGVGGDVHAYVLRNLSNRPVVLRLSGMTNLPPNLHMVRSMDEALRHFGSSLS